MMATLKNFYASTEGQRLIAAGLAVAAVCLARTLRHKPEKAEVTGGESHSANVEGNANVVVMVDANAANAVNIVNNHYHAPLQSTQVQVQVQSTESSPSSAVPSDETGRQLAVGTARRRAAD